MFRYCAEFSKGIFQDNNTKAASNYLPRALNVAPDSLFFGDTIGYLCVLLGEESKGQKYTTKLLELQPDFVTSGKRLIGRHVKHEALQCG